MALEFIEQYHKPFIGIVEEKDRHEYLKLFVKYCIKQEDDYVYYNKEYVKYYIDDLLYLTPSIEELVVDEEMKKCLNDIFEMLIDEEWFDMKINCKLLNAFKEEFKDIFTEDEFNLLNDTLCRAACFDITYFKENGYEYAKYIGRNLQSLADEYTSELFNSCSSKGFIENCNILEDMGIDTFEYKKSVGLI